MSPLDQLNQLNELNTLIDPVLLSNVLQLGGQYMIPAAALIGAIRSGKDHKLPEGFFQITGAALLAGVAATVNGQQSDLRTIITDLLSNTAFTAGLMSLLLFYLLAINLGWIVDVVIGGILGGVVWWFTVTVLGEGWQPWMLPVCIVIGAVGMLLLRLAVRALKFALRVAVTILVIGLMLAIGAGGFLLLQSIMQQVQT
jgi:hypothetical protein